MNLGKNINSLLRRYTEVYVPGVGVFKRIHSPAQFDKQNNVFLPPISYVELDYSAQHGFNMVHYVQQQGNLSFAHAQQVVEDAVSNLQRELAQFGQIKLDDLGVLISYGSSLVFKPLDLSGFNFQPIENFAGPDIETVIPELEEDQQFVAQPVPGDEQDDVEPFAQDTTVTKEPQTISRKEEDTTVQKEEDTTAQKEEDTSVPKEEDTIFPIEEDKSLPKEEDTTVPKEDDTTLATEQIQNHADVNDDDRSEQYHSTAPLPEQQHPEETELLGANTLSDSDPSAAAEEELEATAIEGAITSANSTSAPILYEEEPGDSNAIWYWITAAIVVIMVIVGVFYTNPALKNSIFGGGQPSLKPAVDTLIDKNSMPVIDTASQALVADSLKKTDSLAQPTVSDTLKSVGVGTANKSDHNAGGMQADPVIKESIPVAQPKYQLVIGSARTMVQAEQEAKRLREIGYKTARAVEGKVKKNRKKVILNTYLTKEEADLAKKSVEKKIKDAWVETL